MHELSKRTGVIYLSYLPTYVYTYSLRYLYCLKK